MPEHDHDNPESHGGDGYQRGSLTLLGSVALGTGVMIGAGIFALTGQVAEISGRLFPLAFMGAAIVVGFSAYSYVKVTREYPSAGGIAMILKKAYGPGVVTGANALLMYFSMVINESLVARTFGTYVMRLFSGGDGSGGSPGWAVPALGVGLVVVSFLVNLLGTSLIGKGSKALAAVKILGVGVFAIVGLSVSGLSFETLSSSSSDPSGHGVVLGFLAAVALSVLAYKGFTTITNSGDEIERPHTNVGRSIIISIALCTGLYLLVTLAVGMNLSVDEIISSRDSALAEAARPALGDWGEWLTIGLAILATITGIIASMFAVSRMLAMLTEMGLVPHAGLKMERRQRETLVYTAVLALLLTVFFDLSRIASLGAIFYIWMDITIHWGVLRHLRKDVNARAWVLVSAIVLDAVVLGAFVWVKAASDPFVIWSAAVGFAIIFGGEAMFLRLRSDDGDRGGDDERDGSSG